MSAPERPGGQTAWRDHIAGARWFGGKGQGGELAGLRPLAWLVLTPELAVRSEIATWAYPDGRREFYQVLVAYLPAGADGSAAETLIGPADHDSGVPDQLTEAHDATLLPRAMSAVLDALRNASAPDESWRAVITDGRRLSGDLTPRVYGGEQSNTNVLLGEVAIMKVFRRLEPGHNLDIEVHDALGRAQVHSTARLYGWVQGDLVDAGNDRPTDRDDLSASADLMMIVEQLREAEDGFVLARQACAEGVDFTAEAAALGKALAEVHRALRDTFPASSVDGSEVAAAMASRLDAAIAAAPVVEPHREGLLAAFSQLSGHRLAAQRIHGDFHLGQTLRTPDGWRIIDFEGEPMKSLAERQLPDSPWRDVAGMLRSFGYATSGAADPTGEAATAWLADVRAAFLKGYGAPKPADRAALAAYEADKAAYEVVYEVSNRPEWVPIPMAALAAIAPPNPSGTRSADPAAEQEY